MDKARVSQNLEQDARIGDLEMGIQTCELDTMEDQEDVQKTESSSLEDKIQENKAAIERIKEEAQARIETINLNYAGKMEALTQSMNAAEEVAEQEIKAARQELTELEDNARRMVELKSRAKDTSAKDMNPHEKTIGSLHLNNILFLRAKLLKHDCLPRIVAKGVAEGDAKVVQRFESMQTLGRLDEIRKDLAHYTAAQRDFQHWKDTYHSRKGNPVLDYYEGGELLAAMDLEVAKEQVESVVFEYYSTDFDINHTGLATDKVRQAEKLSNAVDVENSRKAFTERFLMALFGGLTLIGPMLVMTLHPTKLTQLLTTSLFVIAVAMALAFLKELQPKDIIVATVAYAAVLVVFVGAGSGVTS